MNIQSHLTQRLEKQAHVGHTPKATQAAFVAPFQTPSGPFFAGTVSPNHYQATLQLKHSQIRFGSAAGAGKLQQIADRDPAVKTWALVALSYAARDGESQVGIKHLALATLKFANNAIKTPEILKTDEKNLQPTQLVAKQALNGLIRPDVRQKTNITAQQMQGLLGPTLIKLENSQVDPTAKATSTQVSFDDATDQVLTAFFSNPRQDKTVISDFAQFLSNSLSDLPGISDETRALATSINKISTDAAKLKGPANVVVKKPVGGAVDEPEIPIYKQDTSNAGFQKRAAALHEKGLMSDYQYSALKTILEKPSDGGGLLGGGQMDGGVTKKRLTKYLYEFGWKRTNDILDPVETRRILDEDHAFLDDVKEEIVNYIRRLNHLQMRDTEPKDAKILCLVGPPGVGKTSIAMSVARATNRKMGHISLSNIQYPSDLVGHSSTYVNAQTGRLFKSMVEAGSVNPIIVLDEVDKLSQNSMHGNVANVLLPILDPKQNHKFVDEMLGPEMPLDLSKVMFLVTANDEASIPEALRDRMEIIRLDGYDVEEKLAIAKNHLIPSIKADYALNDDEFVISDEAIKTVVGNYTTEAGVRSLNRKLKTLADKNVAKIMTDKALTEIDPNTAREMLGVPDIFVPQPYKQDTVGRVNGLAVAGGGKGACLSFLADVNKLDTGNNKRPGTLALAKGFPNGNLKKVTEESAMHAFRWASTNLSRLGVTVDPGKVWEVAIAPERGAMEKDGDSAGAAMTTALVSALTGKPIRSDVAMTGTITIHGRVLAIGGVKQKLRGAMEAGINVAFVPKENENDVQLLPSKMKEQLNILSADEFKAAVATNTHIKPGKMTVVTMDRVEDVLGYAIKDLTLLPQT